MRAKKNRVASGTHRASAGPKISGRLIDLAGRLVTTATATYAHVGVGSVEAKVLFSLGGDPVTSADIARLIRVDRAAISRVAQALERRDMVTKASGKYCYITLTEKGEAARRAITLLSDERERRIFQGVSEDDKGLFLEFLGRMIHNMPAMYELALRAAEPPADDGAG
jgi:DNA-binding MarR family transcriptional regulator